MSSFWCKVNTFTIKKQTKKHQTTCYHLQPQETPTPCVRWVSIYLLLIELSICLSTYLPIYLILSVCLQYLYLKCIDWDGGWPLYLAFKSQSAQTSTELLAIDLPFLESPCGKFALSEWEVKCWHFLRLNLPCICSKKREGDASSNTRPTDWWLEKSSKQIIVDSKCRFFFPPRIKFVVEVLNPRPNHIWSAVKCRSDHLNCSIFFLQSMLVLGILAVKWFSWDVTRGLLPGYLIWKVKDSIMISYSSNNRCDPYICVDWICWVNLICLFFFELLVCRNASTIRPGQGWSLFESLALP